MKLNSPTKRRVSESDYRAGVVGLWRILTKMTAIGSRQLRFGLLLVLILAACGTGTSLDDPAPGGAGPGVNPLPAPTSDVTGTTIRSTSTSTVPSVSTSTSVPAISIAGVEYTCREGFGAKWDCSGPGGATAYCSGISGPNECSTRWYPDELALLELVEFEGRSYVCEGFGNRCVNYESGPPPLYFAKPDVWCEFECTYYDPEVWLELDHEFRPYFCREAFAGFQQYDCVAAFGEMPPTLIITPDLFCSGSTLFLECSELWYPSELEFETLITYSGQTYLCRTASGFGSTFGDLDCGPYSGGDPARAFVGALKCSEQFGSVQCDPNEYPSALAGVYFVTIGGLQHACQDTYQGSECWTYFSGSVRSAMIGMPNYYCNRSGDCDQFSYP